MGKVYLIKSPCHKDHYCRDVKGRECYYYGKGTDRCPNDDWGLKCERNGVIYLEVQIVIPE